MRSRTVTRESARAVGRKPAASASAPRKGWDAAAQRAGDAPRDNGSVATDEPDPTPAVATNLRRLRTKRGLSLEALGRLSGVSRAMLGQIELRQSTPTISVLWKIARALNVPFSALISEQPRGRTRVLTAAQVKVLTSKDGKFSSRALFPFDAPRKVEFYELRLAAGASEVAEPHPPGTVENLVVTSGALEVRLGGQSHVLATGDAIHFEADTPHEYRNPGKAEAVMYLVMTYAEEVGA